MRRRVVITGMGCVSPLGNTVGETWAGVRQGNCGIGRITLYDTSAQKAQLAAEVKNFVPENYMDKREAKKLDRYAQLAMAAARMAYESSGLTDENRDANRFGVILASGVGGMGTLEREHSRGLEKGFDRISPFFIPMMIANIAAGNVAIAFGAKAMCSCTVTACSSGANAIGDAFHYIRDGYAEVMLAGGAESTITPLAMGGFTSMKALCESDDPLRASIPFDKERSGFVMGEGAGTLILEEYEHAQKRGAKILGEITGYGATCDAYHFTAPSPDGEGGTRAMKMAMDDAGIAPEQVDYINAHGTSTPINDSTETLAIKAALGEHAMKAAVSSTKSMTGHLLGASGAVEAIICAMALQEGFIPATIGYKVPDEACDLDIVPNIGREKAINRALSNSLGFGGHNATLAFQKYGD